LKVSLFSTGMKRRALNFLYLIALGDEHQSLQAIGDDE
jgi:hypothetical protein